ncbi:hypothetical protein IJI55_00920 [Candidatus Saccharibacteria bacterium]|nr:hypothetical protein [Candidatus Saccharibacteria bacterium]
MSARIRIKTTTDLLEYLSRPELKDRPLSQVITFLLTVGYEDDIKEVFFNQLDHFYWDTDNDELYISN